MRSELDWQLGDARYMASKIRLLAGKLCLRANCIVTTICNQEQLSRGESLEPGKRPAGEIAEECSG